MRRRALCFSVLPLTLLASCFDEALLRTGDGGTSTPPPGMCQGEAPPGETVFPTEVFLTPGARATVTVRTQRDRCAAAVLPVTSSDANVAAPQSSSVRVEPGQSTATLEVTAGAVGQTMVRVGAASLPVTVTAAGAPACPMDTEAVTGRLEAGATVRGGDGSPLAAASVGVPMTAAGFAPLDVTVRCADDAVPEGFTAIGPAVRFDSSATLTPWMRELPFTVPINPGMVPTGYELRVELAYSSPAFRTARVVPAANVYVTSDRRAVTFEAPRTGTWRAVVRTGLGARHTRRRFNFHAIVGASMGAAGAAMIGTRNLDRFDFVAPLGGPIDWAYLGDYIQRDHLGGFCTAAERVRDPEGCARGASLDRIPPQRDLFEVKQHFEHWFSTNDMGGQGGTFDRRSYFQIFRDLTRMFGNAVTPSGMTGVLPAGLEDAELTRSDAERCASPVTLMNYYDADYNPDGSLPVITFCDGGHTPAQTGEWDGERGNFPAEITLAVDVNRNGRRDRGEPVLRRFHEPWRDTGPDGLPSAMEPGYDARTNLDPAGDDYDRQFNPGGTEGNFVYEMGEPYEDVGLDGVRCPLNRTCTYDSGEGNERFDLTRGAERFLAVNPRTLVARAPSESLSRVEFWADGGVRDVFMFGAVSNHFAGGLAQRGRNVHYYNNFAALSGARQAELAFPAHAVDWARLPGDVMLRYGKADPSAQDIRDGDGQHVGTVPQVLNRVLAALYWAQARWPGGDRTLQLNSTREDNAGRCQNGSSCTFDFRSDRANRTGPVSIYLPPGYHDPANANVRYPVIFVLHGYGMDPMSLTPTGFLAGQYMVSNAVASWQRPQKFIMVFPDGRCRDGDGCLRGTFYTDSPVGNARMETFFFDLYDYVDQNFRVRQPEEVEVVE